MSETWRQVGEGVEMNLTWPRQEIKGKKIFLALSISGTLL